MKMYEFISRKLVPISRDLEPERQTELDGIVAEIAETIDESLKATGEVFAEMLLSKQLHYAKAICPMCDAGDPRLEINGREMHVIRSNPQGDTFNIACKANAIWSTPNDPSVPVRKPEGPENKAS